MLYEIRTPKWQQARSCLQKIKRLTRERLNKGTFVVNLWQHSYYLQSLLITLRARFMIYSYLDFSVKPAVCRLPYQHHSSSTNCARELFKGSNRSASLLVCNQKKFFCWGLWIFCEWHHKWSSFRAISAHVTWPRAQPLGQSISLKFSLENRLESESFEPLINFLAFLVQKLWNPSRSSKVSKDSDCSLVSNKNFSEALPSNGLSPGPGEVGQGGLKVLYLWHHPQKICIPNQKIFLKCKLQDLLLSFQPGQ